jgi:hypothetical protein
VNTPAAGIFNQQFAEPKKLVSFAPGLSDRSGRPLLNTHARLRTPSGVSRRLAIAAKRNDIRRIVAFRIGTSHAMES